MPITYLYNNKVVGGSYFCSYRTQTARRLLDKRMCLRCKREFLHIHEGQQFYYRRLQRFSSHL